MKSKTTKLELWTQINRMFRSDGDSYPMIGDSTLVASCSGQSQTIYSANTGCGTPTEFGAFVDFVWNHEQGHLNEAQKPENDLHAHLDSVAAVGFGAEANLDKTVGDLYRNIHKRIYDAADCSHTQVTPFEFWFYDGTGWFWAESNAQHCGGY